MTVGGNLLGNTQNPSLFNPQGTVTLNGAGTAATPELLEAMSADLGSGPTGFTDNFAYGTLILGSNTTSNWSISPSIRRVATAEAVYANSLVVPAGTTLNLNGLNLYVRDAQNRRHGHRRVDHPDSRRRTAHPRQPHARQLSAAGELDDWTFFDRGGNSLTVALDPGSGAAGGPISPQLQWAQVQLLDPSEQRPGDGNQQHGRRILTLSNVTSPRRRHLHDRRQRRIRVMFPASATTWSPPMM